MKIQVLNVRVAPTPGRNGEMLPMVYVDWQNVGTEPVTSVKAHIIAVDADGNDLDYRVRDYFIFVADGKPPIYPGQSFFEPQGEGHFLLPTDGYAATARIKITTVSHIPITD